MQKFICSCPGKVLLCGGYSILKSENHGISLALNVRFRTQRTALNEKSKLIFISDQFNQKISYSLNEQPKSENAYFDAITQVLLKHELVRDSWIVETLPDLAFYSKELHSKTKSGMGSSACLIVSCLAQFIEDNDLLFQLSKEANMIAQNNVGSGFDISTAIYGSQLFSKQNIKKLDNLPKDLQLLMIDLKRGENTVKGVNTVQKYLSSNETYMQYFWRKSEECVEGLYRFLSNDKVDKFTVLQINREYRTMLRQLGELARFEIEPAISTEIINFAMTQPSAIWGICPGAGGYDAIAILCQNISDNELRIISEKLGQWGVLHNMGVYDIDSGINRYVQ